MGLNQDEKDAIKATVAERARARKKLTSAELEAEVLAVISKMEPADAQIAMAIHDVVKRHAPHLQAKTWYGMQAYADAEGKTVLFFQDASKFKARYSTLGFQPSAKLDSGKMWATSFAILEWNPEIERRVIDMVRLAAPPH